MQVCEPIQELHPFTHVVCAPRLQPAPFFIEPDGAPNLLARIRAEMIEIRLARCAHGFREPGSDPVPAKEERSLGARFQLLPQAAEGGNIPNGLNLELERHLTRPFRDVRSCSHHGTNLTEHRFAKILPLTTN